MYTLHETQLEDLIVRFPEYYLKESGLVFISRQFRIGKYIFDLLFHDRQGAKLIVELQRGILDRDHCYKIFDYLDEYKLKFPKDFIDIIIVANEITSERKKMLTAKGIKYFEIPEKEFLDKLDPEVNCKSNDVYKSSKSKSDFEKSELKQSTKLGSPKRRIDSNKYYVTLEEFNELITNYIHKGKSLNDKEARKKIILEVLIEFSQTNEIYLFANSILKILIAKKYQKDYFNSFLRLLYYPLLVSDELFEGMTLAKKIYNDIAVPGNPQYPNFKLLGTDKYDFNKIKLRINFPTVKNYKKTVIEIIEYVKNIRV
jgi:hypothetical protein